MSSIPFPKLDKNADPKRLQHLTNASSKMEGKTVKKVTGARRENQKDVHNSDVLQIEFTDGSIISIETASNAMNMSDKINSDQKTNAEDFNVTYWIIWKNE